LNEGFLFAEISRIHGVKTSVQCTTQKNISKRNIPHVLHGFEGYCVDFLTIALAIPSFSSMIFPFKCPSKFEDFSVMELMTPEGNITIKAGLQPSLSTDISKIYHISTDHKS
jgi:hypothetical protein